MLLGSRCALKTVKMVEKSRIVLRHITTLAPPRSSLLRVLSHSTTVSSFSPRSPQSSCTLTTPSKSLACTSTLLAQNPKLDARRNILCSHKIRAAAPWATWISVSHVRSLCTKASDEKAASNLPLEDRLARYPELSVGGILRAGDYLGTATFAMTGTLTAAASGMDLLGCVVTGTITAVGGGTIRDMLLGHENGKSKRAFWMDEEEYLWISIFSSVATFFWWNHAANHFNLSQEDAWIFWLDSCGIGVFCCIGAMNGVRAGLSPFLSALCGMITSTFGGLTRDVLTHRPVRILHSHAELYATTAFCGGGAYVAARMLGMPMYVRAASGFAVGFGLRTVAWLYDIKLPVQESIYHH